MPAAARRADWSASFPGSVTSTSTSSAAQILANARRLALDESAATIARCARCVISRLMLASRSWCAVAPASASIPVHAQNHHVEGNLLEHAGGQRPGELV